MATDLTTRTDGDGLAVTSEQTELIRKTLANGATDTELQLYFYDCRRHGVHPLDKLIHFTKRKGKYTPITSIDLLRSRAADTDELGGIDDPVYCGEVGGDNFSATVTVYRIVKGQRCPFTATARWIEYKPSEDFMWRRMPCLMLGKCAEALALRKAFPKQLAGLYAKEEMDQAGPHEEPATAPLQPAKPAAPAPPDRAPPAPITVSQAIEIRSALAQAGIPWAWLASRYDVERLGQLNVLQFDHILGSMSRLQRLYADQSAPPTVGAPMKEEEEEIEIPV